MGSIEHMATSLQPASATMTPPPWPASLEPFRLALTPLLCSLEHPEAVEAPLGLCQCLWRPCRRTMLPWPTTTPTLGARASKSPSLAHHEVLHDLTMPWTPLATPPSYHRARMTELAAGESTAMRKREAATPFAWTCLHLAHHAPERGEGEVDAVHRRTCLRSTNPHGVVHHGPAPVDQAQ